MWLTPVITLSACVPSFSGTDEMPDNSKNLTPAHTPPVRLILDTDMGNDIDDALALALIHALQSRGECNLLGVTLSKDNPYAPVYVDILNTFYGRGRIPVGVVEKGVTPDDGNFVRQVAELTDNGRPRYARTREPGAYPDAVSMIRKLLAEEPDGSVVLVMIGFSTNMARLLDSPPDDISRLNGHALFAKKVSHVVMMAANFTEEVKANPTLESREYNILKDIPSAKTFIARCPRPILFSGLEVGSSLMYPGSETEHLYNWTPHHPVADAYRLYLPMPYDRPSWDLTAVLAAVRPDEGYFGLSEMGGVAVDDDGIVSFKADPGDRHRHLTVLESQREAVIQAMVDLVTQPVKRGAIHITATLAGTPRRKPHPQPATTGRALSGSGKDPEPS